jgi:heavy-metal exporter, HME family
MFKLLLKYSLNNRLLIIIISLAIMLYGVFTLYKMPVDVFPDLNKPTVTLMTESGGMASEEVEQLVTFPLETAMNGLPNIQSIRSTSSAGLSIMYISFDWGMDIFKARQMVSERLGAMEQSLPKGVTPQMGSISSIMGEIMQIAIPLDASKTTPMAVREYADFILRPRLMSIAGVAQVIPIGGEVRQFQVQPDTAKMAMLNITYKQLEESLRNYSRNSSGGFLEFNNSEYLIRYINNSSNNPDIKLQDMQNIAVANVDNQTVTIKQIANVVFAASNKRGDAGYQAGPAVILGIQKQPTADTINVTKDIEKALDGLNASLPIGIEKPKIIFKQANFIQASIDTLKGKLIAASFFVAIILFIFVGSLRTTVIALTAIPVSVCITALTFKYFNMSINTMTLGGLAIAIGGLVDDAIVDVENIIRRLKLNKLKIVSEQESILKVIYDASMEVRSSIIYATAIIVLVFLPLFALPGVEGRFFIPLGIAFIVSTLASLFVSMTITPVLSYYLLPKMVNKNSTKNNDHVDTWFLHKLKIVYVPALNYAFKYPKILIGFASISIIIAIGFLPFFKTTFLPPFNEGTLTISMQLKPGVTLDSSSNLASKAEALIMQVPEVEHVGRRSGRGELDEHAEGVHSNELDVSLKQNISGHHKRSMSEIKEDIRNRVSILPATFSIGQPISHRIDHMMSGVRSQIAIKIFGSDLDTLRSSADELRNKMQSIPGIADIQIEKQVLSPQIKVRIDQALATQYSVSSSSIMEALQGLTNGEKLSQVVDGNKRFDVVLKLSEQNRTPENIANIILDNKIPLSKIANVEYSDGPNQISRDNGQRRIVISANNDSNAALSDVVASIRNVIKDFKLPESYFITVGGQFEAAEQASKILLGLSIVAAALMFLLLYNRYQSSVLSLLIMSNIPLALVGAVIGLKISGQPLSIAALVGFITLAGISVRNDILKTSHYIHLMQHENEVFGIPMIIRASSERLSPVLMTALVTAFALFPLLLEAEQAGTEILHPVAVVIFSGLISSTLIDSFLTPVIFYLCGRKAVQKIIN